MSSETRQLGITSWYINTHRVLESIGVSNLPSGFLDSLNRIEGHPLQKSFLVSMLSPVLVDWIRRNQIPSLEKLLISANLSAGSIFTFDGKFFSHGLACENPTDAELRLPLKEYGDPRTLFVKFHADNLTTASAHHALMGQPSVFVVACVDSIEDEQISCRPYVIGNLIQVYGSHQLELRYRDYLELRAGGFDALAAVNFEQRISTAELDILKNVSEAKIKRAFAEIFNELAVPKDWGGEECDLFTSSVSVDKAQHTVAFAFKGPSKFKPMECSDCGKNGDQIVRLFDTGADILVLQHCHAVKPAVRKTMAAFARGHLAERRRYCVIDGYETLKILRHFRVVN